MLRRVASTVTLSAAVLAVAVALPHPATADLQQQIGANAARDRGLQSGIAADQRHIAGYQGRISDLRARLDGLQSSLDEEEGELETLRGRLRTSRGRLTVLRISYVRDRRILAQQLLSEYEAPHPSLVDVVLHAHGFADLLETADRFKALANHNADIAHEVKVARGRYTRETARLTDLETRQARVTEALEAQRDNIARLKLAVVERQLVFVRARSQKRDRLKALRAERGQLRTKLRKLQEQQYASIAGSGASGSGPGLPPGGAPPWSPHGGSYGFFQAPGTNYVVGDTPRIAARLDVMGKVLHLHLIGLSGYRTPQHSVEVGGFANDPHTRGEASDTPGLEGVPEATLNKYGLTRPFGGVAELDHVQLVGSI